MKLPEFDDCKVTTSEHVNVGSAIYAATARTIVLHPLDYLALKHRDEPLTRLAAAMKYFVDRAHHRLDDLEDQILDEMETTRSIDIIPDTSGLAAALAALIIPTRLHPRSTP